MTIVYEERQSDSPYIETVTHGRTLGEGRTIRPAESHWHMVIVKVNGQALSMVVGPLTSAGTVSWGEDAEILWIKFKLGTFMPHLPVSDFRDVETLLPGGARKSFWLKGSTWQIPDFENVDTFVARLVQDEVLVRDPVVSAVLQAQPHELSSRTVRHRFLRATGLTQSHIYQIERAQRAAALLRQGASILDAVDQEGYFDQPHLTRSLKQWVGHTPAQIIRMSRPECSYEQETIPLADYDTITDSSLMEAAR